MSRLHFFVVLCLCSSLIPSKCDNLTDFYTLEVEDIEGNVVSLEKYRGTVSLVVNVASLCGFTDTTYRGLKRLQDILGYGNRFQVLAFPCNQFGDQEPYDNDIIQQFAVTNYAVEFPMFAKVDVIGEEAHPAFKNLISQSSIHPEWNFYKYLVGPDGRVIKAWSTKATIDDIFNDIKLAVDAVPLPETAEQMVVTIAKEEKASEPKPQSETASHGKDEL
uniref:Glutathione peroxidase n=1 Tax=Diaphanosoma celebensis TaxID=2184134 RepID=A0A6B7GCJ4_9CRUS|nr:glutathione peroxidase [Diaphanosoma celebensis]